MLDSIAEHLPDTWNRYFEPMAGGAALFFRVRPSRATLADVNAELINFYEVLKLQVEELIRELRTLKASSDLYYRMRRSRPRASVQRAVRFAYLNRLAWNGLYRENRGGIFNVPIGDRLPEKLWDFDDLRIASAAFCTTTLKVSDFSHVLRYPRKGDFVFLDPPYPKGATDMLGFNRYNSSFFTADDHRRLSRSIERLSAREVMVMLVLGDHPSLRDLYPSSMRSVLVRSKALIACNGHDRKNVSELILVNY